MRVWALFLAAAASAAVLPEAQDSVREVPVYENKERKIYEKPLFTVLPGVAMQVMERDGDKVKVSSGGKTGWADRKSLGSGVSGQHLSMKEVTVFGFLDQAEPVYILDFDRSELRSIRMDRDFILDPVFLGNIDREKFEWENEVYYYKDVPFKTEFVSSKTWK